MDTEIADGPPRSPIRRLARSAVRCLVFLFVAWQLFFLLFRGALDLDHAGITKGLAELPGWTRIQPAFQAVDRATRLYGNWCGIEQGWSLFAGPVARGARFLAARIDFEDGSSEWLYSENEPNHPARFLRLGGWRQRKLEDYLAYTDPEKLPGNEELSLWGAYVRWCVARWHAASPDDPRTPARVALVARYRAFPEPNADAADFPPVEEFPLGVFSPEGKLQ